MSGLSGLSGLSALSGLVSSGNTSPTITVPAAQSVAWTATKTFSGGSLISIADPDGNDQAVTLDVSHGTLTLSGTTGLSFTTGDGTADASMAFSGTLANVNAALDGMIYTPDSTYAGPDSLEIEASDGSLTDSKSVAISVVSPQPAASWTPEIGWVFQTSGGDAAATGDPVGQLVGRGSLADDGTATGSNRPTLNATVMTGLNGANNRSLSLNGSQRLDTTYNETPTDVAVMAFFHSTSVGANYQRIVDKGFAAGIWIGREATNANKWGGGVHNPDPPFGLYVTLADGADHSIINQRVGTTQTIIGDGGAVSESGSCSGSALDTTAFVIGTDVTYSAGFTGRIYRVLVYHFGLSMTQAAYLHAGGV
jgi:hypothetical protein